MHGIAHPKRVTQTRDPVEFLREDYESGMQRGFTPDVLLATLYIVTSRENMAHPEVNVEALEEDPRDFGFDPQYFTDDTTDITSGHFLFRDRERALDFAEPHGRGFRPMTFGSLVQHCVVTEMEAHSGIIIDIDDERSLGVTSLQLEEYGAFSPAPEQAQDLYFLVTELGAIESFEWVARETSLYKSPLLKVTYTPDLGEDVERYHHYFEKFVHNIMPELEVDHVRDLGRNLQR